MAIVLFAVAAAIVFVIAAVAIGREARRLSDEAPRPVFDMDEAVEWIGDRLPFEVGAQLSHDDVRAILRWSLELYRASALSSNGHGAEGAGEVVVGEAEVLGYVVERARDAGHDWSPGQIQAVLGVQLAYLEAIGAVGPGER
jgi:hypothetical protein